MAFKQLKDLIDWITEYHEALENQYDMLASSQDEERIRVVLQFLASREHRMAKGMDDFLQDAEDDLMDAWLVDSQNFSPHRIVDSLPPCNGCQNIQDVLRNILQSHETLTDIYRLRARLAQNRCEAELADNQQAEAHLQSLGIGQLEMY
jgi:hypothetical protein